MEQTGMKTSQRSPGGAPTTTPARATGGDVGASIREWRNLRRMSQMELALEAGISPRHLSFVETGRSRPSPEVLLALAQCLSLPLRDRNAWLLAAGYAPRFGEQGLGAAEMAQIRATLTRLLDAHDPYPGVVLDRHWNVVLANRAAANLTALLPEHLRSPTLNLFRASLHPDGFAAHTLNFPQWGSYMLGALERLAASNRDATSFELLDEVRSYPGVDALSGVAYADAPGAGLLVPCVLELGGARLSMFTTLTTFGTPRDITLEELCIELFYPADAQTEAVLRGGDERDG
jgi:transcriptional regulator with XRE-family HTH domain